MSERTFHEGVAPEPPPPRAKGFVADTFGAAKGPEGAAPAVPKAAVFEEFAAPAAKRAEPFKPDDLGGPSLGYLFAPFDPGATEKPAKAFEEMERPKAEDYSYEDLDLRDQNIINTLDKANKRAKEIVIGAFEQGRRAASQALEAARLEAADLAASLKAEAEREASGIVSAAKASAEEIKASAEGVLAEAEKERRKLTEDLAAAAAKEAELKAREAAVEAKGKAQEERQAALDAAEAEMAARRAEMESRLAADSAAALARIMAKGEAEGVEKGLAEGRRQGQAEVLAKAEGFFKIMAKIDGVWRELWRDRAPEMAALAVEAAEAIVNKEIAGGRGLAAGALEACVEHLQKCHQAAIRVRPEDLAEVEAARAALRDRLDGLVHIEFKADESLGPGDVIMESDAGRLDATMKARRERIMGVLREALDQGRTAELPPEDPPEGGAPPEGAEAAGPLSPPEAPVPPSEAPPLETAAEDPAGDGP